MSSQFPRTHTVPVCFAPLAAYGPPLWSSQRRVPRGDPFARLAPLAAQSAIRFEGDNAHDRFNPLSKVQCLRPLPRFTALPATIHGRIATHPREMADRFLQQWYTETMAVQLPPVQNTLPAE